MQPWYNEVVQRIIDGDPYYLKCSECRFATLPPRVLCPKCNSRTLEDRDLSKSATVLSYTEISHTIPIFSGDTPYTVVIAEFDEGVRLTGQLRGAESITTGEPVSLGIEDRDDGVPFVTFTPAE